MRRPVIEKFIAQQQIKIEEVWRIITGSACILPEEMDRQVVPPARKRSGVDVDTPFAKQGQKTDLLTKLLANM